AVAYQSFRSLMHRFADRHRFRHRVPCASKVGQKVLDDVWMGNAFHVWSTYGHYPRSQILNINETGVYFDMPPGMTLAEIGKSSKCKKATKHSERLTAVMMIRADGVKLPILFIVKGKPGGTIDTSELPTYPPGHVYAVAETMFSVLEPLQPNSTSRCQPLDVGVMGPLKAMLKTAWLLEDDERNGDILTAQEKRLATVKRTIKIWDRISTDTIVKAFDKAIPSVLEI
ncbi:hypothetical protein B5M09_004156, partial [Aphanomyces astaci]